MTTFSVCATNYNCAHSLKDHLYSVYRNLEGHDFEYVVVDNRSRDGSPAILREWAVDHPNFRSLSHRCTMGEGRQLAFERSTGTHILVLDTDVVYGDVLRRFLDRYVESYVGLAVQALYCGVFPRGEWEAVGGRRSLNTNEDADMWLRLWRRGTLRWYPLAMGTNRKDPETTGSFDHLSSRYAKGERLLRLVRREWDLLKTREVARHRLEDVIGPNTVDLGLGAAPGPWPQSRVRLTWSERATDFVRNVRRIVQSA